LMLKKADADANAVAPEALEGARSATGSASGAAEVKRWSTGRKRGVVLRLLRGEPVDAVSREVGVTIAELERWREQALAGMEAGLKARTSDPLEARLNEAVRRVGELTMTIEILNKERERQARRPLSARRSST
jgi:transposase